MADKQAVKETEDVETPAPVAESASAEAAGDSGAQIEGSESGQEESARTGRGEGPIATITELRRDRRQLRAERDALQKQVQELMARTATEKPHTRTAETEGAADQKAPSFFEDPDRYLNEREQRVRTQVMNDIVLLSEKQQALNLIRTQPGFQEGDEEAFADLMEENGLDIVARTQPLKAAKLAAKLWQEEKGIQKAKPESKARAASVRGGAPGAGANKVSLSHIRNLQTRLSKGENVDAELQEAWTAAKEGRIVED